MANFIDLKGKRFGKLTVIKRITQVGNPKIKWLCKCDCGRKTISQSSNLNNGHSKSCGCIRGKSILHGMSDTRFYRIWSGIKERCNNKNLPRYIDYGGRGIKVCKRWYKFENFRDDMIIDYTIHIIDFGKKNTTIERINNSKGYSKSNCRWATIDEQVKNKRSNINITSKGKTQNLTQWSKELNINYGTLYTRINRLKWSFKKALVK